MNHRQICNNGLIHQVFIDQSIVSTLTAISLPVYNKVSSILPIEYMYIIIIYNYRTLFK